jgi:4-hydroxy-tetrahydrodipicolinate reductase
MKKIAMFGICGRMGTAISSELIKEDDVKLVAGFDCSHKGIDAGEYLGAGKMGFSITDSYDEVKKAGPDLIIDFTVAESALRTIEWAAGNGIDIIVGTTGLDMNKLERFKQTVTRSGTRVLVVPNFAIGAVIMMKISGMIAGYFDNCEIIEMHHDGKKDAPSGTSLATAAGIAKNRSFNTERLKSGEKENIEGSRGGFAGDLHIHSIRLPGLVAHQEVLFGARGQTLSIRHDSMDRASFYPGVILAVRNIEKIDGYAFGLDRLIEFK